MNQKELVEALAHAADSTATENEPKRDAGTEAELLGNSFVAFSHQHDFTPVMIVREKVGCSLLRNICNGFLVVLKLRDDEPLFDLEARDGTAGFRMPLEMLVGKVDEHGDLISL
jgi:hypothetical protein